MGELQQRIGITPLQSESVTQILGDDTDCLSDPFYPGLRQRAWAEIDKVALHQNLRQIQQLLRHPTQLMAVVKADAYGHGALTVARTAIDAGAGGLCVATVSEGIQLRQGGIKATILLLGATNTPEQVKAIAHWQLEPTLCNPQQALVFSETLSGLNQSLPVHLKLDTGMSRLGMPWQDAIEFVRLVQQLPNLEIASVYSHLATADSPDPTVMRQQHQRFKNAIAQLQAGGITPPRLHLANSAATLTDSALHYDWVRVGLALYGLYPAEHLQNVIHLQPVMQVKARITQIKTIPPGTGISYGHQFISNRQMRIAVVGIGYADGVPRNLSNRINVIIRGQQVPQIGAITMDQLMLDVSDIPNIQVGEIVTLIGQDGEEQISADDWAMALGTISWEIICGFKHRLPRVVVG
ncbi:MULTISPECIES: alanine racemase [unclassified Moorena]|uniref:alanine racemase n=1 Tax=unclassified Moorena TaxID=2683338 RepID=UPI0013FFE41B|nr:MULTISPECIES: alanine racemase [unclassified Moorena]NEO12358.1 alanine racemase [Moorena sp. SIO3E8]NEP99352.1 alanine racemase [Moorena sp. SIO3F7]